MSHVIPNLTVLTQNQIEYLHNIALTILEKTGVRIDNQKARAFVEQKIGQKSVNNRVYLPRELVQWAIDAAPGKVQVKQRDLSPGFTIGGSTSSNSIFGIGVTNLHYQDPLTDKVSQFSREHMAMATRLGEALPEFDTIATPGVIQDNDAKHAELIGFLEMLANTRKPITLLISTVDTFEHCLSMSDEIIGEQATRESLLPYFNPITPLILNEETTRKIDITVSRGMPFIFSNYGMSGATCPITPGGTLALLVAELLSGLVYSQLLKEGTPIVLGSLPAAFDMRTMMSYYTPQCMLINLACAEMMAFYDIPHCGTSGGWMGWGPDLMSGSMLWLNHLTSIMGKVGLVPFVGNNFDSLVFSPAIVVYSAEVIRMARAMTQGFSIAPEKIALDEIIGTGPGGSYLTAPLTMKEFRTPPQKSEIWPFLALEKWKEKGCPRAEDELRTYTHKLMEGLGAPSDSRKILEAGESYINALKL